jgi:putative membrane protein
MRDWIIHWIMSALALAIIAHIPMLDIHYTSVWALLCATIFIGLVNSLVRPILMFLNRPLNCLTFGLSALCINALLFWMTGLFVQGFTVGFGAGAFVGPILMSLIGGLLSTFVGVVASKKRD